MHVVLPYLVVALRVWLIVGGLEEEEDPLPFEFPHLENVTECLEIMYDFIHCL